MSRLRTSIITFIVLFALALPGVAQTAKRRFTIDDIYDRAKRIPAAALEPRTFTWADETHFYFPRTAATGEVTSFVLVDAVSGEQTTLFDPDELQAQVAKARGRVE